MRVHPPFRYDTAIRLRIGVPCHGDAHGIESSLFVGVDDLLRDFRATPTAFVAGGRGTTDGFERVADIAGQEHL